MMTDMETGQLGIASKTNQTTEGMLLTGGLNSASCDPAQHLPCILSRSRKDIGRQDADPRFGSQSPKCLFFLSSSVSPAQLKSQRWS
ncbi:hypothetical protein R3I93_020148 [Phoxinus phoxinus]|uniref:Uncharacterized protein n=1 Tax=Phoxinus phoxinus TaxID=58324 RepID=A0AAN9C9B7_9TELE